ncbi:MAG: Hsp33 family molecular chaperone HslO [Lachnospiraceae bacterium]
MEDYLVRATAGNSQVRAFAVATKNLVEFARNAHNTSPVATAALGRLLTAGAMMGSTMKNDTDVMTLKIECEGPIGGLLVTADNKGNVKGYVNNPNVLIHANSKGKLDVAGALDLGVLSVIKDIGLKEPYVGQTILVSGEIAEDLTYYYAASEQTPSSVALGVLMNKDNTVRQAGGFMIQLLPFAEEETIAAIEKNLANVTSVTSLLEQGMTPEEILEFVLGDLGVEITDRMPVQFQCNCSKSRVERALASIATSDLEEMIADNKPIEVNCHFCNTNYTFSVEELQEMVAKRKEV